MGGELLTTCGVNLQLFKLNVGSLDGEYMLKSFFIRLQLFIRGSGLFNRVSERVGETIS